MTFTDRAFLNSVALIVFLASIVTMLRGGFGYPVELFLIAMLGVLLLLSANMGREDAASSFLYVLFFLAAISNVVYLYGVAGHMSLARLGTLGIAVVGMALAGTDMFMQPVPGRLQSDVKKLLAAEKKFSEAREKFDTLKAEIPKRGAKHAGRRGAAKKK